MKKPNVLLYYPFAETNAPHVAPFYLSLRLSGSVVQLNIIDCNYHHVDGYHLIHFSEEGALFFKDIRYSAIKFIQMDLTIEKRLKIIGVDLL